MVEFGGNRRIRLVGQPWVPSVHSDSVHPRNPIDRRENEDLLARSLLCILLSELMENFECQPLCVASIAWKIGIADRNQLSDAHCSWFFVDPHAVESEDEGVVDNGSSANRDGAFSGFKRRSTM